MTFEELQKANEIIKTTNIKGKEYAEVNQRVKAFRKLYPNGTIETELISFENNMAITKTKVFDGDHLLGTGLAYEKEGSSVFTETSCIEVCETSSVGRALGFLGIGIDTSIASADEVTNAEMKKNGMQLASKNEKEGLMATVESKAKEIGVKKENLVSIMLEKVGFDINKQPEGMTVEQYAKAVAFIKEANDGNIGDIE